MSEITLHPDKGVNAHITFCPRCGNESNGLILLGIHDNVYKCTNSACGLKHIGKPKKQECQACGSLVEFERALSDSEAIPGELCDTCKQHVKVVEEGGVFFKCSDCSAIGAIPGDNPFAQAVREKMGIKAPNPCGVEFSKNDCPVCSNAK